MAKVVQEKVTIVFSKLVRDGEEVKPLVTDNHKAALNAVLTEVFTDDNDLQNVIIEVDENTDGAIALDLE